MTTKSAPRTKREPKAVPANKPVASVGELKPQLPPAFDTFIEHQRKAISESGLAIESLLPEAFKEHSKTAVKETIEGYRELVNSVIDGVVETIEKMRIPEEESETEEQVPQP